MNILILIGNNIKKYRKLKGYTQEQLAKKISVSKSTLQKYESGEIGVPIETLNRIANMLEVNIVNFFVEDYDDILIIIKDRFNLKDNNHGQLEYDFNILIEVLKMKYKK